MNVANYRRLLYVFVYCGVAVLVIVNGQSTTDDDIDKDEISRDTVEMLREEFRAKLTAELRAEFRAEQEEMRAELQRVKGELAAISAKQSQESTCKFNSVTLPVCNVNLYMHLFVCDKRLFIVSNHFRFSRCVFTNL